MKVFQIKTAKLRTGHVANSSSTGFTCSTNDYKTAYDLALAMIDVRDNSNNDSLKTWFKKTVKECKIDKDINISFSSCNYDTYITVVHNKTYGKYYVVSTCDNEDWYSNISMNTTNVGALIKNIDLYHESSENVSNKYWHLELDIYGTSSNYCDNNECDGKCIIINNKELCTKCDSSKIKDMHYSIQLKCKIIKEIATLREKLKIKNGIKFNLRVDNFD